jgi:ribonuclease HI
MAKMAAVTESSAALKRGYYVLNTDGGNLRRSPGDLLTDAAIGVLLRTRRMATVAQLSRPIGLATHNTAEYVGLIEGLKVARDHAVRHIRIYMDSELVVDQMNGRSRVKEAHLGELYSEVRGLLALFDYRISWVPREWNLEADQLVRDALDAVRLAGGAPPGTGRPQIARTTRTAPKRPAVDTSAGKLAPKAGGAAWRSLPRARLLAHLLATPQIADAAHTAETRKPGESREAFLRRLYGPAKRSRAAKAGDGA